MQSEHYGCAAMSMRTTYQWTAESCPCTAQSFIWREGQKL